MCCFGKMLLDIGILGALPEVQSDVFVGVPPWTDYSIRVPIVLPLGRESIARVLDKVRKVFNIFW